MFKFDFRARPPYDITTKINMGDEANAFYSVAFDDPTPPSAAKRDMDLFWKELDEAGIDMFYFCGRRFNPLIINMLAPTCDVPIDEESNNRAVADFITKYPNKAVGAYCVDPSDGIKACEAIEENVINGPFQAVTMEPGISRVPMPADDVRCCVIYEYCEKHNIPVTITFGELNNRSLRHSQPQILDNICELFPNLKFTAIHGGWPYVTEICYVAYNRYNFYVCPDQLVNYHSPGYQDYITACNYLLQDKMIYATCYPFHDMVSMTKKYEDFLRSGAKEKVMGVNGLRALNLDHLIPEDAPKRWPDQVNIAPEKDLRETFMENHVLPL